VSSPPEPAAIFHFLLRCRLGKIERKEKGVQGSGFWLFCSTQQLPRPAIGNLDSQIIFAAKCGERQQPGSPADCAGGDKHRDANEVDRLAGRAPLLGLIGTRPAVPACVSQQTRLPVSSGADTVYCVEQEAGSGGETSQGEDVKGGGSGGSESGGVQWILRYGGRTPPSEQRPGKPVAECRLW